MKAQRNKTIDISLEDGKDYLARSISVQKDVSLDEIRDKVICGDTFGVMKYLPENFVDLAIVDPPYNLTKDYNGKTFRESSDEKYIEFLKNWILLLRPRLKETASLYVCCDIFSSPLVYSVLKKYFIIKNRITWQREKGRGAKTNWKNGMEDIWFATVSSNYYFDVEKVKQRRKVIAPYKKDGQPKDWEETEDGRFRDTCPSNFWDDISIPYWSMPENTAHPTQKPEKLMAKLILASSKEGDFVFDPFLGSGSTAVTAKKLNRHFSGIEQNEEYIIWAEKRLEMAESDSSIQGFSDGVFWERNTLAEQRKHKNN